MTIYVSMVEQGVTFVASAATVGVSDEDLESSQRRGLTLADETRIETIMRIAMGCLYHVTPEGRG